MDFDKNAYSPGDTVEAKIKVRKPDGTKLQPGSSLALEVSGMDVKQSNVLIGAQGEVTVSFKLPNTVDQEVVTLSVSTYLGFSEKLKTGMPSISSHSFQMLDDNFKTEYFPEWTTELVPGILNKVYFQVVSVPRSKEEQINHIEFADGILVEDSTIIQKDIKQIHNGRGAVSFMPKPGKFYSM